MSELTAPVAAAPGVTAAPVGAAAAATVVGRGARRSAGASVALHATLVLAVLIALFPIVWVVLSSFKPGVWVQSSDLALVKEPTLENYRFVLAETNFPRWFVNSVIVGAFTMLVGVFMAATTGYALSRFNFPGRRQLMMV